MESADSAKQFLLNRLTEQASTDDVPLSDIEKRMFLFSEGSPNPDWEANEKFEAEFDDAQYEKKIAKLLHCAYAHDKKAGRAGDWDSNLKALAKEDFYGLVMVDQAKIPRPKAWLSLLSSSFLDPAFVIFGISECFVLGFAFALLLGRIRLSFLASDTLRLAVIIVLFVAAWVIGQAFGRFQARKMAENLSRRLS
jgi:hypothetical protein